MDSGAGTRMGGRTVRSTRTVLERGVVGLRVSVWWGRDFVIGSDTRAGGGDQMLLGGCGLGTTTEERRPGGWWRQGRSLRRRDRRPGLEGAVHTAGAAERR